MKVRVLLFFAVMTLTSVLPAVTIYEENFESYAPGTALAGQSSWVQQLGYSLMVSGNGFTNSKILNGLTSPGGGESLAIKSLGDLSNYSSLEMTYDSYGVLGSSSSLFTNNTFLGFSQSVTSLIGWSYYNNHWQGSAGKVYFQCGEHREFITNPSLYNRVLTFSTFINRTNSTTYGIVRDAVSKEILHTSATYTNPALINNLDNIYFYQDYRYYNEGRGATGAQFDNITVSGKKITIYEENFESYAPGTALAGQDGWVQQYGNSVKISGNGRINNKVLDGITSPGGGESLVKRSLGDLSDYASLEMTYDSYGILGKWGSTMTHNSHFGLSSGNDNNISWIYANNPQSGASYMGQLYFSYGQQREVITDHSVYDRVLTFSIHVNRTNSSCYGIVRDAATKSIMHTTATYTDPTLINNLNSIILYQDYRYNYQHYTGAQFDNITISGVPMTNLAPLVALTSPIDRGIYYAPSSVVLSANAFDTDGSIAKVEFYSNAVLVATDTTSPYSCNLSIVTGVGNYMLSARAYDNKGLVTTSEPVSIISLTKPTVSMVTNDGTMSETGNNTARVTFSRSVASNYDLEIKFALSGIAINGLDYTDFSGASLNGTVIIPAGSNSANLVIYPFDDSIAEGTESFVLTMSTHPNYNLGASSKSTITIGDNEPTVSISAIDAAASESPTPSDNAIFRIYRSGVSTSDLMVPYAFTGSAVNGFDFISLSGNARIPAGATSVDVGIIAIADNVLEGQENIIVTLVASTTSLVNSNNNYKSATIKIIDNETPRISLSMNDAFAVEPGLDQARFTLTRSGPKDKMLEVFFGVSGTATEGVDFVSLPRKVVIPAGNSSVTVPVIALDDNLIEGRETVIITLLESPDFQIYPTTIGTINILDNETNIVSLSVLKHTEETGALGLFRVSRSGGDNLLSLDVNLGVRGTASKGLDYSALPATVTIPAGFGFADVSIVPLNDSAVEGTETVIPYVLASNVYQVGAISAVTINVYDDEKPLVQITADSTSKISEAGGRGTFTVKSTPAPSKNLNVPFVLSGTALVGTDFSSTSSPVMMTAGSNTVQLSVMAKKDANAESDETVIVTLGLSTDDFLAASSPHNKATLTIASNPANTAPTAISANIMTVEDQSLALSLSAKDAQNDPLTYIIVTNPSNGTLSGNVPYLVYTPNSNFFGLDSFLFKANDGITESASGLISLYVTGVNDVPVGNDDYLTSSEDSAILISDLLLNDGDTDGGVLAITEVGSPSHGSTSRTGNSVTYIPHANYNGMDSFWYTLSDGQGGYDTATVYTSITPVNDPPIVVVSSNLSFLNTSANVILGANVWTTLLASGPADEAGQTLSFSIKHVSYDNIFWPFVSGPTIDAQDGTIFFAPAISSANNFAEITIIVKDASGINDTTEVVVFILLTSPVETIYKENFEGYAPGTALAGQDGWVQQYGNSVKISGNGRINNNVFDGIISPGGGESLVKRSLGNLSDYYSLEMTYDSYGILGRWGNTFTHNSHFGLSDGNDNNISWIYANNPQYTASAVGQLYFSFGQQREVITDHSVYDRVLTFSIHVNRANSSIYGVVRDAATKAILHTTATYTNPTLINNLNSIILYEDYRYNYQGATGAQFDNITVSGIRTPAAP